MKKETFITLINAVVEQDVVVENFKDAMSDYFGVCEPHIITELQTKIVYALMDEMDCDGLISWWLYDAPNSGKDKESSFVVVNGVKIPLETPEQLYDYLVSEQEKKCS